MPLTAARIYAKHMLWAFMSQKAKGFTQGHGVESPTPTLHAQRAQKLFSSSRHDPKRTPRQGPIFFVSMFLFGGSVGVPFAPLLEAHPFGSNVSRTDHWDDQVLVLGPSY